MNTRTIILALLIVLSLPSYSQRKRARTPQRTVTEAVDTLAPVRAFADSLSWYRHKLDSMYLANDSLKEALKHDGSYYRLFSPLTYDPQIAGRQFTGGASDASSCAATASQADSREAAIESTLLSTYMQHPEQVSTTVGRLHASASRAAATPTAPIRREVEVKREEVHIEEELPSAEPM